jgi:biopolymer transport protein ExbB/TolQ
VRVNSEKAFFHCSILESLYLIFLISLVLYVILHVYFFLVVIELYLEIKAQEPAPVVEDVEAKVVAKEEELQLLESPKVETQDETDKVEDKPAEEEKAKEEGEEPKKEKKSRCGKLNCTKDIFKCPSIGNCVGPDNFE